MIAPKELDPLFRNEPFKLHVEETRCQFARYMKHGKSGNWFVRECRECLGCRMARHDKLVATALTEADTSWQVWSFTGTYGPAPDGSTPNGAKRHNPRHIQVLVNYWKERGVKVRKIVVGEYGSKGRAHWHGILFIPLSGVAKEIYESAFVEDRDARPLLKECEPENVIEYYQLQGFEPRFKALCDDREKLIVSRDAYGSKSLSQLHASWPYGECEYRLLHEAGGSSNWELTRAVAYVLKYITKDPWRDSKKFNRIPFENLPPWVQQVTAYGPWQPEEHHGKRQSKWVRRNDVRKAAIQTQRNLNGGLVALPVDEQPYVARIMRVHHKPCLGGFYHFCLGRFHAKRAEPSRKHKLGGYYVKKKAPASFRASHQSDSSYARIMARHIEDVQKNGPYSELRRSFYHTDGQHLEYGAGYNFQMELDGNAPSTGIEHSFDNIETKRADAKRMRDGAFYASILKNHSPKSIQSLSVQLLEMGWDKARAYVSKRDWPRVAMFARGPVSTEWQQALHRYEKLWMVGELRAVGLLGGKLRYLGYLDAKKPWFNVPLNTWAQFETAVKGKLPSPEKAVASYVHGQQSEPIDVDQAVLRLDLVRADSLLS